MLQNQNKEKVSVQTLLAYIGWYKPPITLWYPELEPTSAASFMPINRIACRCAQAQIHVEFTERPYNNGQTVFIIPISGVNMIMSS